MRKTRKLGKYAANFERRRKERTSKFKQLRESGLSVEEARNESGWSASDDKSIHYWRRKYSEFKRDLKKEGINPRTFYKTLGSFITGQKKMDSDDWERKRRSSLYRELIDSGISENQAILKSGWSPADEHSAEFWARKYSETKAWLRSRGIEPSEKIRSMDEFISLYSAAAMDEAKSDNPHTMRKVKYLLLYKTDYKTAIAELKFVREQEKMAEERYYEDMTQWYQDGEVGPKPEKPKRMSFEELKNMSTVEFAELHKEEIKKRYYELRNQGLKGKEAQILISAELFGSP